MSEDYRVNLDVYNGPLDLLLYLIRREEVDIHNIPIAKITQQYIAHIDLLKHIDPDLAGEFLVMAATLLEIKTRMLLPKGAAGADEPVDEFDPRAELVRQLLEYKAFKDAAGDLREAALQQAMRFPRRPADLAVEADAGKDLEDVQIWDLVEAFNTMMAQIGQGLRQTEILYDDTPIELHMADLVDRLQRDGNMTFQQVFAGRRQRSELIGLFLALLELIRYGRIRAIQEESFADIQIALLSDTGADASTTAQAPATSLPGQYVSDAAPAAPTIPDAPDDEPDARYEAQPPSEQSRPADAPFDDEDDAPRKGPADDGQPETP